MPDVDEIYDVDTGTWVKIERPIISEEDDTDTSDWNSEDDTGELSTQSVVTNCADLGKRHKFKDRQTGITHEQCLVCGAEKPKPGTSRGTRTSVSRGGKSVAPLDIVLSAGWSIAGTLVSNVVPAPSGPVAGRVMHMEAGIAGPKLHKALKKTPIYPYIAIASGQFGWLADLGMLILPPVLMGLIAQRPELAKPFRGVLVTAVVPVIAEAVKHAEQQAALMEQLEGYDAETVAAAEHLIDSLFGGENGQTSD